MTANVYVIDSSSLIELNKHNAMDVFVSVWDNISQLIKNDRLVAPKEVFNEIKNYDDTLTDIDYLVTFDYGDEEKPTIVN